MTTPALTLTNITLDYPDGLNPDGSPRTVRALDTINLTAHRG